MPSDGIAGHPEHLSRSSTSGEELLWDTFWSGGSTGPPERRPIEEARDFLLVVKGYNA